MGSTLESIQVRQAKRKDLESILGVLDEAGAWLQSIGVQDQWPESFSTDADFVQLTLQRVQSGQFFVAESLNNVVGCFRLSWQEYSHWPRGAHALYLGTLAVKRALAGSGVAYKMLDWATDFARSNARSELRLDCWSGNQRLRQYYLDAGFEWRGDVELRSASDNPAVPAQNRGSVFEVSLFARRVN